MPFLDNEEINKGADQLVDVIRRGDGDVSTKLRPVHARGQLVKAIFVPSDGANYLSNAPIFENAATHLLARCSCDTGYKDIRDTDVDADPCGLAVRFLLSEDGHTNFDMITNTAIRFPVDRGECFGDMFRCKLVWPQGVMKMGESEAKEKKDTYLFDNLEERLQAKPPKPIAQIADPKVDNLNDSSSEWPEDREFVHLGTFTFDRLWTFDE